mgnify:FL=1
MRPTAFIGTLALATALGGVLLAELVVVPGLELQAHLIDANLAKALTGPLHLRQAEVVLASVLVLAAVVPRWLTSTVATTAALLSVALAAGLRLALLPSVYTAWSRVDRVAGRPVERIVEAERLSDLAGWLSLATLLVLGGIAWIATGTATRSKVSAKPSTTEPARSDVPQPAEAAAA